MKKEKLVFFSRLFIFSVGFIIVLSSFQVTGAVVGSALTVSLTYLLGIILILAGLFVEPKKKNE